MIRNRRVWLMLCGGVVIAVGLFPYLIMILTSLKPADELFKPTLFPSAPAWQNYVDVWRAAPLGTYLKNSLFITVAATGIVLLASAPAAYYVARHQFRGKQLFMMFVLFTQMIAPTAVLIGVFRQFRTLDLVDNPWALILTDAAFNLAFSVWILTSVFQAIPTELEEAARLDGCGHLGVLMRVVLPLSAPGLVTAAVFTFVAVWNEFVLALTLMSTDAKLPLSVGITSFIGQYDVQWQYLFAASVIGILPVVALFAMIEKRLVGGLTAGAVK